MAETKADAEAAFDAFIESCQVKYEKAAESLNKDRDALLVFLRLPHRALEALADFKPHRKHVRHRTIRSKGCLSNLTLLAMVFKLVEAAQRSWRTSRWP